MFIQMFAVYPLMPKYLTSTPVPPDANYSILPVNAINILLFSSLLLILSLADDAITSPRILSSCVFEQHPEDQI